MHIRQENLSAPDQLVCAECTQLDRRRMKQGGARQAMVPVALSAPAPSRCEGPGHIEVVLDTATVRFYGTVDSHNARTLLSVLR